MSTTTIKNSLSHELHHVLGEVDHFLKSAAQGGDERLDALRGKLVSRVKDLRFQLDELEDSALHEARRAIRKTDQALHRHPYGAMGVAAAAGLLIGFLAARR